MRKASGRTLFMAELATFGSLLVQYSTPWFTPCLACLLVSRQVPGSHPRLACGAFCWDLRAVFLQPTPRELPRRSYHPPGSAGACCSHNPSRCVLFSAGDYLSPSFGSCPVPSPLLYLCPPPWDPYTTPDETQIHIL